ncbi:MAG: phenylalanine--tRNA ligase subunit beta, partial [Chitinophagales bacterium]
GEKSGVKDSTTSIFLESAYFDSIAVRKTSTRHGLRTDAASRYEKGADPNIVIEALKRAASLIAELAGGKVASDIIDIYPEEIKDFEVKFRYSRLKTLSGADIPNETVKQIFADLDIKIISENGDDLVLNVPPYRADVQREADVIEEVMRIYGFNNIATPATVKSTLTFTKGIDAHQIKENTAFRLNGLGYSEMMTNSISKSAFYTEEKKKELVKLQNSMTSELDIMRSTLLYEGLEVIAHNINRKATNLRLFEFGNIYHADYSQSEKLVIYLTGNFNDTNWKTKADKSNFYHLKAAVNAVFSQLNIQDFKQVDTTAESFDFGLDFVKNDKTIASLGAVDSDLLEKFDIAQDVFYAELDWKAILKMMRKQKKRFALIPKFPAVSRDLAMILDNEVDFEAVKTVVKKAGGKRVKSVDLFDVYKNEEKIGADKKSYAINFTLLNEEKTMTDKEIDKIFQKIMRTLEQELSATIRK